jgi:hypothetical protein
LNGYNFTWLRIILCFLHELLQLEAAGIDPDYPFLSVDDTADQIADVRNFIG